MMMTELSFLLDILMNHKLQKHTKELIVARIKEVELAACEMRVPDMYRKPLPLPPELAKQSPSTLALMAKHGDIPADAMIVMPPIPSPPEPVTQVAHTVATAQALASRQAAINEAISGKIPKGQERPRKF